MTHFLPLTRTHAHTHTPRGSWEGKPVLEKEVLSRAVLDAAADLPSTTELRALQGGFYTSGSLNTPDWET